MTKDEIMNMPAGIEIDQLIALRVFGDVHPRVGYLPKYSTEMTSTLMVIDEMEPSQFSTYSYIHGYGACINSDYVVIAETLQLAVCRAALIATL